MLDKTKPISGAITFDKIEDALAFFGCKPDMSPKAQAERQAWQDEAAMTPNQRRAAYEARRNSNL